MSGFVLVTGGNRGIGYEICRKLLVQNRNVIMTSRDLGAGQQAASQLLSQTASKAKCEVYQLDQSDSDSVKNFSQQIKQQHDQQIHTIVNNAGMMESGWTQELFDQTIKTNVVGPVQIVEQLLPCMQQNGRIVNVSSGYGSLAQQSQYYQRVVASANSVAAVLEIKYEKNDVQQNTHVPTYKVSKAMLNRYTQLLAADPQITSKGISVNAVCPGWCRTRMGNQGGSGADRSAGQGADSVLWLVDHPEPSPTGGFYRDGYPLQW
eukprot:TRINITY_DN9680_c1_g1_i2.p1 TRINITY_DN9680_c1_g1~~TRINITY_DN9680_c1_g1_i2.p1  ORF type:complete len:263 (+),score=30.30 TRINITY_DN9680_c1_g1_i2:125-913(+)